MLLISIALSAIVTALTPLAVQYGIQLDFTNQLLAERFIRWQLWHEFWFYAIFLGDYYGLIATRVILGFVQGPTFPCLSAFVVPWYPVEQRGRLCSIGYIGISVLQKKKSSFDASIIWNYNLKSKLVAILESFFTNVTPNWCNSFFFQGRRSFC